MRCGRSDTALLRIHYEYIARVVGDDRSGQNERLMCKNQTEWPVEFWTLFCV